MSGSAHEAASVPGTSQGVHGLVARQVARTPDACAVRDTQGHELTYAQLWERSGDIALRLENRGVGAGARVAVAMERSPDLVATLLGVLRTGAAYVPLDPHAPRERQHTVLGDCQADAVIGTIDPRPEPSADRPPWLPVRGPSREGVPAPGSGPSRAVAPEDTAFIGYTSGSTGRPKGVMLSHLAIERFVTGASYCEVGPGDRVAQVANPSFDPVTFEVWNTLAAGATVVILPAATEVPLEQWVEALAGHGITVMFLTTALVDMVHRAAPGAFAPLRTLLFGGEAVDPDMVRGLCAVRPPGQVLHVYGPTETTTFASYFHCTTANLAGIDRVPIGFPLQDTTLRVLGPDLTPVPDGEPGELCIGGPRIATAYLGQPDLTTERFVVLPNGERAYRSGDLVRRRHDGALEFVGRKDRQVKLRGFRIELEEVERAVTATGLVESVVIERAGEGMAAGLVGFVVPKDRAGAAADTLPRTLCDALARTLPGYMVPRRWQVVPSLPVTANGKVDRRALLAGFSAPTGIPTAGR
ncbi:amino acid adenylation domain-containing protein [Streptomyces sp. NPDC001822]|uniref:amino acid adenylation domain-containing protein n=1 Tax=Streptomyces sp. NPDC001822 TaxID=3364614 RepID=UPI00368E9DB0